MAVDILSTPVLLGTESITATAPLVEGAAISTFANLTAAASFGIGGTHANYTGRRGCRVTLPAPVDVTSRRYLTCQYQCTLFNPVAYMDTHANGGMRIVFVDGSGNYAGYDICGFDVPDYNSTESNFEGFFSNNQGSNTSTTRTWVIDRNRAPDIASATPINWGSVVAIESTLNNLLSRGHQNYLNTVLSHNGLRATGAFVLEDLVSAVKAQTPDRGSRTYNLVARTPKSLQSPYGVAYSPMIEMSVGDGVTTTNWTETNFSLGYMNTWQRRAEGVVAGAFVQLADGSTRPLTINQSSSCVLALSDGSIYPAGDWSWVLTGTGTATLDRMLFGAFDGFAAAHGVYTDCIWDGGRAAVAITVDTEIIGGVVRNGEGVEITGAPGDYSHIDCRLNTNSTDVTVGSGGAGVYDLTGLTAPAGYTVKVHNASATNAVTVKLAAGIAYSATTAGGSIAVEVPAGARGLLFTGLLVGSTVKVFETGTQVELFSATNSSTAEEWSEEAAGSITVDYTVLKDGYLPIRVTGVVVTGASVGGVLTTPVQQVESRAWVTPSGLTFGTSLFYNPTTKLAGLTVSSTLQNLYCQLLTSFRTEATLQNKPFPMTENGPNSFSWVAGSEFNLTTYADSITNLSRDGMRYVDTGGIVTAIWAALLSVGTPSVLTVRYQQADGTGTADAGNPGGIDQLVQIYGDTTHGNFDKRGYLVLKAMGSGYDQAEFDAVATYGNLEDQLYVAGLAPLPNGIPAQSGITGITITDHGASPVTWNSKTYSITITDSGLHSGEEILQYVRDLNDFNYHDLVRNAGSSYVTARGKVYGDLGATLKGVRVLRGADAHPDFTSHVSDDGTAYVPPVLATAQVSGIAAGSRMQIYNVTTATEMFNDILAGTSYSTNYNNGTGYSAGDVVRIRLAWLSGASAKLPASYTTIAAASGWSVLATQEDAEVYNTNAIDGDTVTEFIADYPNVQIDISDPDGATTPQRGYAWYLSGQMTADGLRYYHGAMTAEDIGNYRINVDVADMHIQNVNTDPVLVTGPRLYRSDGSPVTVAGAGPIQMEYGRVYTVETGVSGLTSQESDKLMALPSADGVATAVAAHPETLTLPLFLGLK